MKGTDTLVYLTTLYHKLAGALGTIEVLKKDTVHDSPNLVHYLELHQRKCSDTPSKDGISYLHLEKMSCSILIAKAFPELACLQV